MNLVVDTWVWERAQSTDGSTDSFESIELLSVVCKSPEHVLLIDYEDEIKQEYELHIRAGLGKYFYETMTKRGKFRYHGRTTVRIVSRFDPDDVKFIEVAYVPPRAPVISGDSDFMDLRANLHLEPVICDLEILRPGEILPRIR